MDWLSAHANTEQGSLSLFEKLVAFKKTSNIAD
jgi:hypothetical protein